MTSPNGGPCGRPLVRAGSWGAAGVASVPPCGGCAPGGNGESWGCRLAHTHLRADSRWVRCECGQFCGAEVLADGHRRSVAEAGRSHTAGKVKVVNAGAKRADI